VRNTHTIRMMPIALKRIAFNHLFFNDQPPAFSA